MANRNIEITPELEDYIEQVGMRETPEMNALRAKSKATLVNAQLAVLPHEANFLAFLVRLIGAKRIIEIGVYAGYSTLAMAQALPEDGRIVAFEWDERFPKVGRPYWQEAGVEAKIDLSLCDGKDGMAELIENSSNHNSFDLVFIDADKASYETYYEQALILTRPKGLICVDNVLWQGRVIEPDDTTHQTEAIRRINKLIRQDDRVEMSLLPAWDGLTLVMKR